VKLQVLVSPQVSLAVVVTVVVPSGKVLPLGGEDDKLLALHPPLAVAVKYTCAPLELVCGTVMLAEHVNNMGKSLFAEA